MAWLAILIEEIGEAGKYCQEAHFNFDPVAATADYMEMRKELIQVAAVAVAMIESLDRNQLAIPSP